MTKPLRKKVNRQLADEIAWLARALWLTKKSGDQNLLLNRLNDRALVANEATLADGLNAAMGYLGTARGVNQFCSYLSKLETAFKLDSALQDAKEQWIAQGL